MALLLPTISGCSFSESKLVTVCEEVLKLRLLAPAGYKRIEINESEESLSRDDYKRYLARDEYGPLIQGAMMKDFDRGRVKPRMFEVLITYDAPNAYGTPIRGTTICQYPTDNEDTSRADRLYVIIDGWPAAGFSDTELG
ncbi:MULTISPECIES: hypothetical protein [Rhizobium]|uniref:Uncharacterized protein n=1 Tax=Rhizobium tropici TaxID=398 RepID=A0ABR6QV59_RHITR|nr:MULTISPECIES: hypothetical protein [Rhizobium]MBB4239905.1 hypothetical protein [Rhizobium tropici]MBB5591175.1 hypothetical protein [Rhizobium tropici]MBB6490741.1 hypothetical protein [Rhizobium tropici]